jgi:Xaa-Pro aminopeptidase
MNMTAPPEVYRERRAMLAARLPRPLVLLAGRSRARHYASNTYPFRQGSSYWYFGGPPVPGAALIVEPGADGDTGCALARAVLGFEEAVWMGGQPADAELAAVSGLSPAALITPDDVASRLKGRSAAFVGPPCPASLRWMQTAGVNPAEPEDLEPVIGLRLTKDEHELIAMRRAATAAFEAHREAARAIRPGSTEAEIVGALMGALIARRCGASFTPIVTVHGEVLHTDQYVYELTPGRMLVMDAGAEEPGGYASDITRTYPVSGTFNPIQRQLYDTVLRAEQAAIAACVPGRRYRDVHDLAARVLCEGLVEADLLRGDPEELVARHAQTLFFVHGVGHLIGLDVHDMEDFGDQAGYAAGRTRRPEFGNKYLRLDRDLEPGMAVTIEPGLYLVPDVWKEQGLIEPFADVVNRPLVDRLLAEPFGGIRIEDTICVRPADAGGPEVLSGALPVDAEAVAGLVAAGR